MSKQRVQLNAADLLTMSPSKGPKMPLHTLMGLQVHLAYVLAHFARRLLLPRNSAFSSQNSIRENISLHFLLRKIFPGWLKILRRMWIRDAKPPLFWMSPHGKVSTHGCTLYMDVPTWQSTRNVTIWQSFHSPSTTARRYLQCQGLLNIEHGEVLTWKICKTGVQGLATYEGEP